MTQVKTLKVKVDLAPGALYKKLFSLPLAYLYSN